MIVRILVALFLFLLVMLGVVWALGGGPSRAISSAHSVKNPIEFFMGNDSGGSAINLPWQIPLTAGPAINFSGGSGQRDAAYESAGGSYADAGEYAATEDVQSRSDVREFGDPSPYIGRVSFAQSGAITHDAATEFLTIQASSGNGAAIAISGWSLQSVQTGVRMVIPQAAPLYAAGAVNAVARAALDPGAMAIINSGPSPAGVSFRENKCSGYLAQFQTFSPPLDANSCPGANNPPSVCANYVRSIPPCHFPGGDNAPGISPACRSYAANALSYNGCVQEHHDDADFMSGSWRTYLASGVPLWRTHDTVRLLDERGRVVDMLSY